MQEESILDVALADLFTGKSIKMLNYILSDQGVTPEMLKIKKISHHDDIRNDMRKSAFKKISQEAAKGNLFAVAYLGVMYEYGYGVKKDLAKAVELYEKSAKGNNPLGLDYLGGCLVNGVKELKKFKADPVNGVELYRKGTEQNHSGCIASLSWRYEKGTGVEKNSDRANQLCVQAAKLGDAWALQKLTRRGAEVVKGNPFLFYAPENTDFTYEELEEQQAYVHDGPYLGSIVTSHKMFRLTIKVTYTGPVDIGDKVLCMREISPKCFDWAQLQKAYGYEVKFTSSQKETDQRVRCQSNLVNYHTRKALADIIREADGLISQHVQRAMQQPAPPPIFPPQQAPGATAGYPGGVFFQPQPTGMAVPQQPIAPMDPQTQMLMLQMQMMQQNPQYAAQMAALAQQFQQQQQPPQGNNNNAQRSSFGQPKK